MKNWLKITEETIKDKMKTTSVLTLIFAGLAAMYIGVYPSFKNSLEEFTDMPMNFIRGFENLASYPGYLNMEMYQIFWVLILAILIAYIAASLISEEIEGKTIDMLMSNPISRQQIVIEKFLGLIPLILIVNFVTMGVVYGLTFAISEEISFSHLFLTHLTSIPYFLSITGISILISTFIDKKMKASLTAMGVVVGMYILESVSLLAPKYEKIGLISITHYYDPSDLLIKGNLNITEPIILITITITSLLIAKIQFERRDIAIT